MANDRSGHYAHKEDQLVLDQLNHLIEDDLDFSFPPGPIFGPLKTVEIVLYYANPGVDDLSLAALQSSASISELFG